MNELLKINYEKYRLDNGLDVILFPERSLPLVSVNLWYRVGSANETEGKTGFAHLFEHMMFQGSRNVPKQMHFKYIQEAGGNLNGSTSLDRTNYYQSVPANYLELVLWLESDRMGFLIPAMDQEKLDNQIDVVKNERRQRYENAPYGLAWELLFSNLYHKSHPYHWPTIGWMKDIANINLSDVVDFFHTYYAPNNASIVIGGDINIKKTRKLVDSCFGSLPAGSPLMPLNINVSALKENQLIIHKDNVTLERLYFAWHSMELYSQGDAEIEILSYILSGSKSSRLYKTLVFDKEIAQDVSAFQNGSKHGGSFLLVATVKPGTTADKLKEEIFIEIEKLLREGITDEELTRAKNNIRASFIYSMQNINSLTNRLNEYYFYLNEPDSFNFDLNRYQQVTRESLMETAIRYLRQPYIELRIIPANKNEGKE